MKEILAEAGLRVPHFAGCENVEQTLAFAETTGYPLIVKPVNGAGQHRRAPDPGRQGPAAACVRRGEPGGYEIEEFITGTVHHVDGFAGEDGTIVLPGGLALPERLPVLRGGAPLGSVVVQRGRLRERIEEFTQSCVSALGMRGMPFHMELFVTGTEELVFLEVAGRIGGAEVPYVIHKLFGVNLFEGVAGSPWVGEPLPPTPKNGDPSGGWVIIPKPRVLPAEVVSSVPMSSMVDSVWRELVPQPGDVIDGSGGYDSLQSGRGIVVHDSEAQAEADLRRLMDDFRVEFAQGRRVP
ncbi:hypothetical protein Shyd_56730 [Streptomyces hydrogenans]|uniref:ATP-grasp domain-containing protein n=1 Tax=Streptomyces hydrogenans TaxID=1873719 RepID=A0ABQ3PH14_9ACTN|nr:hypothetical protein [Streptomyces hydrogenans]GHI24302.1 hypothetical protein Shyd_56730 [Streptomyces hydrogenans]